MKSYIIPYNLSCLLYPPKFTLAKYREWVKYIRKIKNKDKLTQMALEMQCLKESQRDRDWIIEKMNIVLVMGLSENL